MDDNPAFEVIHGIHIYRIWADGRIEGFPPGSVAINRIPQVVAEAVDLALENAAEEY